jgi:hypothetical protein
MQGDVQHRMSAKVTIIADYSRTDSIESVGIPACKAVDSSIWRRVKESSILIDCMR